MIEEITEASVDPPESSTPKTGISLGNGLIPLNLASLILILITILFPSNIFRIIFSIPFLLFSPGYTLMAALFPKKEGPSRLERLMLSFTLSIAVVPLIGLILNYAWDISLEPVIYSAASFILIASIVAWFRQRNLAEQERLGIKLRVTGLRFGRILGEGTRDKVITIVLVAALLGALGILGAVIASPRASETFTEFYILGREGELADYPSEFQVGREERLLVGIVNHEGKEVSYRVEAVIGGKKSAEIEPAKLLDKQKWEGEVSFVPELAGDHLKLELLLYRDGEVEPYLAPLQLWVDVREISEPIIE